MPDLICRPSGQTLQLMQTNVSKKNSNLRVSAPHPAAQTGVEEWHRILTDRDLDRLPALLIDDVTYHNPVQFEPYRGRTHSLEFSD